MSPKRKPHTPIPLAPHRPFPGKGGFSSGRGLLCTLPLTHGARQEPQGAGGTGLTHPVPFTPSMLGDSVQGNLGEDPLAEFRVFFFSFPETSGSVAMRLWHCSRLRSVPFS